MIYNYLKWTKDHPWLTGWMGFPIGFTCGIYETGLVIAAAAILGAVLLLFMARWKADLL